MQRSDLKAVAALEVLAYPYPWSKQLFEDSLSAGDDCSVMVSQEASAKDAIIGHAVMTTVLDDATILNIAIHPDYQQQGLGRQLLNHLLQRAQILGARQCFLEVRSSNMPAITMYHSAGFVEVGRRRNYYPSSDEREDALVLQRTID